MAKWLREALEIGGYIAVVLAFCGLVLWLIGVDVGLW